jgi:hypothetical protein
MTEDALTEIRKTEANIRQAEVEVRQELADLEQKEDTSAADDRAAYAEALAAGAAVPKPTSARIKDRIRDIKMRVLPGTDEALWTLVPKVVEAVGPNVNDQILTKNLRRWQRPDPGRRDQPSPTQHLAHRPTSVVDWVLGRIAAVEASEAKQREEDEREERKRVATERVNRAQADYDREQSILLNEREAKMSVTARNAAVIARNKSQTPSWPKFNRLEFLEREGLVEDYGWTQHGVSVKGGRERVVEQVPASEIGATNYTEA